jgi:hypothetical protein
VWWCQLVTFADEGQRGGAWPGKQEVVNHTSMQLLADQPKTGILNWEISRRLCIRPKDRNGSRGFVTLLTETLEKN